MNHDPMRRKQPITEEEAIKLLSVPCVELREARLTRDIERDFTVLRTISKMLVTYDRAGLDARHIFQQAQRSVNHVPINSIKTRKLI